MNETIRMKSKKIVVPTGAQARVGRKNRHITKKRNPTAVHLSTLNDPTHAFNPTMVLRRRWPKSCWLVPPLQVPLYWFDRKMVAKKLIIPVPPDTFLCDGRRFKVLAQDQHTVGRFDYTRWLVYEELAVGKGNRP